MQLAAVIGNTTCRFAWMEGTEVRETLVFDHAEIANGMAEAQLRDRRQSGAIPGVALAGLCSVVPQLDEPVRALCAVAGASAVRLCVPASASWFPTRYRTMDTLGADRFCAVLGARELHGAPVVVVDCGTATTVNVVDREGEFLGGSIAPGVHTALRALHEHTAQLPALIAENVEVIGRDSAASMRSGVVHFTRFAVEGMVREIYKVTGPDAPIILTGGNAPVLLGAGMVLQGLRHDPDLLFRGIIFYLHFTR